MARLAWFNLPEKIRLAVESQLGATVVQAVSQSSGFSPGSADRLVLSDGRRVFVKAVAADVNPDSIKIHRREAEVLAALPSGLPMAQLLGLVDTGDWVALILEDVDGHQPTWEGDELVRVLDALVTLASVQPDPVILGTLRQSMNDDFQGWQSLIDDMELRFDDTTNAWIERHRSQLIDLENGAIERSDGNSLVHYDMRADNILLRQSDGQAIVVDWPWACVGSPWFDAVILLVNVKLLRPSIDLDSVLATHPVFAEIPADTPECFIAGLAGFFTFQSLQPDIPAIPGLRQFQHDQGAVALDWLQSRLS